LCLYDISKQVEIIKMFDVSKIILTLFEKKKKMPRALKIMVQLDST
jgi:hypothetical protein